MDHDRAFKELISSFFIDFIDLFLPEISRYLDRDFSLVPVDKETLADLDSGTRHEADLVVKAKVREVDAYFLVHIEHQARSENEFAKRMFRYFARLEQKYYLPVYPVVIYSHDSPTRAEPDHYEVTISGRCVLKFQYVVIQLNRLSWRDFVNRENPVAAALMAKMRMSKDERPRVKLECYRLLTRLNLDPARSRLIGGFIDAYLRLGAEEMKSYEREFSLLDPDEKETTMALVSDWEQKGIDTGIALGIEQGIEKGIERVVARQIRRRFYGDAAVPEHVVNAMARLSPDQLDDLGEALLDFATVADLDAWLANR